MNKLYNQLKNIVAANVVRCARTTTYKHLGSLHNPLSHGNWSKGAGMYGGKVGGGLAKTVGDRLRQREGMSGAARRAEASPAAAGLRRAQAGKSETQNFLNRGQKSEQQNFLNRGHLNRGQKSEQQNFLNRGRPARGGGHVKLGDLPRTSKLVNLGDLPRTSKLVNLGDLFEGRGRDKSRTAVDYLWRGKKGAKDEPRTAVDFPRRGQAGTGKRTEPQVRDNSGIRNKITEAISNISRGRQRQTPAERMSFQRQEYERRQKAPIVRTKDGLPKHYEWVYGKGGDRLLPVDRPGRSEGGRQTMEYRPPLDSRGNQIPRKDLPQDRPGPYYPPEDGGGRIKLLREIQK